MTASDAGRPATELVGGRDAAAYNRAIKGPTSYGPLVCVCAVPAANSHIDFGMCQFCSRKPLALFTASTR